MIRVALFIAIVGLIALGVTWLADRPGEVAVTWLGWRIETSLMVLLSALLVFIAGCILVWSILRGLWRSPRRLATVMRDRREARAQRAMVRGLIAIGAGDVRGARRHAEEAHKLAPREPLALLLAAQAAQLGGDRRGAERAFRDMAGNKETRLLGLRGLFIEAQRNNDMVQARLYAEEAVKIAPALPWAGQAALQIRCAEGDWVGALDMLEQNRASGALDRSTWRRHRAVLLTARALALAESDRETAKDLVLEAVKLAPALAPAAALAARFLAEGGDLRKASRIVERAWQAGPQPELADTYAYLRFGDSARDRLARVRKLAGFAPDHIESALALARAAIDARDFAPARRALAPFLAQPTQRVALLMSDLEQADAGDEGRAREWTARAVHAARDPAWTADGLVSERWMPISPVSGRLDAFEWKAPLAEIDAGHSAESAAPPPARAVLEIKPAAEPAPSAAPVSPTVPQPVPQPTAVERRADMRRKPRPAASGESVIPLAHAPDDPGPDIDRERDPVPEAGAGRPGWTRLFL